MPGQTPSFVNRSLWHTPQACTLMRTSPAAGLGISRSTISKSAPGLGICAAFIGAIPTLVVAMMPPAVRMNRTTRENLKVTNRSTELSTREYGLQCRARVLPNNGATVETNELANERRRGDVVLV